MFIIRQATIDDANTLLKLARMVHFINLPADPDIIAGKISRSRLSFMGKARDARERMFMFVLEDTETGNVIGTSALMSCVSWPGHPHTFLHVRRRELYSEDLQTGAVHVTLQLGTDETGPSEMGGLILSPSYRGHREKLGSVLSLIRFHWLGLHRAWFSERIIAEMMAPLTPDSRNTLWEYLGRRFINLSYTEADSFCQHSKEFITSLFPKEEIYASLLPPEARNLIARVGPETRPARAMLEALGFQYKGHIDPFDGGPYLEAKVAEIPLVQETKRLTLAAPRPGEHAQRGFVSYVGEMGFRAVRVACTVDPDAETITIPPDAAKAINASTGDEVGYTPTPSRTKSADSQAASSARTT